MNMKELQSALRSAKVRKYGFRLLVTIVLYSVIGFLVLPPIVKSLTVDQLSQLLHRPVMIDRVSINPYALTIEVDGVRVQEKEGAGVFASFDRLFANLQSSSIFRGGPVLREIRLENPTLRITRLPDDRYNVSDLIDDFMAQPKSDGPTPAFSLNNIQLSGGSIEFDDQQVNEKHVIDGITLTLPFISSMAYATESFVEPLFSANINGAPLAVKGKSKPFAKSLESELVLDLSGVKLAKYFDYIPASVDFPLPIKLVSGDLDTLLTLKFHQEENQESTLQLSGSAAIRQLDVSEASGAPLVSVKQLQLDLGSTDLFRQRFAIDRLQIESPEVFARVDADGKFNWLKFVGQQGAEDAPSAPVGEVSGKPAQLSWSLADARLSGGAVHWQDESSESNNGPSTATIDSIDVGLQKLDSKGGEPALFSLSAALHAGAALDVKRFKITGGKLDLAERKVSIDDVQVGGVSGQFQRAADHTLQWLTPPRLAETSPASVVPAAGTGATDSVDSVDSGDDSATWQLAITRLVGEEIGVKFEDRAVSPPATQTVEGLILSVENLSTAPGQKANVSTHFKLNRKGDIAVQGSVLPSPLSADLKLNIKTLELLPLQPYFSEKLNIAVTRGHVTVSGDMQLRQSEATSTGGDKKENIAALSGGFTGEATIGDFSAVDKLNSADFLNWKSFYLGKVDARLGPNAVSIGDVALTDFFARVIVSPEGKLNLLQIVRQDDAGPTEVVPAEDGAGVATKDQAPEVAAAAKSGSAEATVAEDSQPAMPFKVDKITLQGGSVRFTDNFVKPNYTANLKSIGGGLTGLSSEPGSVANLELRGSYDDVAPLNLTAKINPLSAKPYLDLQADVKGVELTPFSSYSGKYAGYAIEKGKLSLFVKYRIENDELKAENRVFLDQLTFGDAVDSPSATKLPVRLAVSLLKNRKGEIDLDLPISGSLNDPQFSVGGLVVKVVVNLLVKAVTSPFALLGSMFDSGEEMSNVEFAHGLAAITPEAQKRLDALAKALVERPQLKLEIESRVYPEQDREGLKAAGIARKVRALKRLDLTKSGVESDAGATIEISDEEYPALLERVYRAEKFPKPRNTIGLIKSLPVEEMEKLMLANSNIGEDDLRDLGDERAKVVRDWLVAHEVAAERIFLLPSKLSDMAEKKGVGQPDTQPAAESKTTEKGDGSNNSRVEFSLK